MSMMWRTLFATAFLLVTCRGAGERFELAILRTTNGTGRSILVYLPDDGHRLAHAMPLVYGGPRVATDMLPAARGQSDYLRFDLTPSGAGLVLGPSADAGALGPRWRFVAWDNATLVMTRSVPPVALGKMTRFQCVPSETNAYCDLGVHTIAFAQNLSMPDCRVIIDPDRPRGVLPPLVYFMLTNGRAASTDGTGGSHLLAAARETQCIRAGSAGLMICDGDVDAHFAIDPADNASTIVLGGTYWHSRFAMQVVDQWTMSVYAVAAASTAVDPGAVQIAGTVFATVILFFMYGMWLSSAHAGVSYAGHLEHVFLGRHRMWSSDVEATIFGWLLIPLTGVGLGFAWLSPVDPGLGVGLLPLAGPNLVTMRIVVTVYACMLLLINVLTFFPRDLQYMGTTRWSYVITMPEAWLRVATNGPLLAVIAALCLFPIAWSSGPAGDRGVLLMLGIPFGAALVHHAYASVGLVAFTVIGAHGAKDVRGGHAVLCRIMGALSFVAMLGWAAVLLWFYLAPFVSLSSAYFGDLVDYAAAALVIVVAFLGATGLAAMDYAVGRDVVDARRALKKD